MLDLSHIPNSQQDIQIFYANQGNFGYQTWRKPRKCNFVYILSIDGGGGGAGGVSSILNSNSGLGKFGGGSGAVTRALINSSFVPDILYVKVGKGGIGGASLNLANNSYIDGTTGESSGIFCLPNLSSQGTTNEASSFLGGATANNGGTLSNAPGTPASVLNNNFLIGLTNFISLIGVSSVSANINPLTSQIITAGCSGATYNGTATPFNGLSISASLISPLIAGGIGGTTLGGNGADGITSWKPFFSTGGAGGGNATTAGGVAGNGGNGGIGSGGGAGGSANAGTSGKGGDGGDGIVMIISF